MPSVKEEDKIRALFLDPEVLQDWGRVTHALLKFNSRLYNPGNRKIPFEHKLTIHIDLQYNLPFDRP